MRISIKIVITTVEDRKTRTRTGVIVKALMNKIIIEFIFKEI